MSFRLNAIIVATVAVVALAGICEAQPIVFNFDDIANTGSGSFLGGQLFGSPVIVEGASEVAFSGQSIQRATGIFIGNASSATLLNQDPASQPTRQVLEVSPSLGAIAVDFTGALYKTSVAATNQARTTFPDYFNRGINAAIDSSGNVVYVNNQNIQSIIGVPPGGPPVTVAAPFFEEVPTNGYIGPKIAEKGNQVFGPSMIFSESFASLFSFSDAMTLDNPLTIPGNYKLVNLQIGDLALAQPPTTYLTDISGSGQFVTRTFVPDSFINGHNSPNGQIVVTTAQDWIVVLPETPLPSKTLFMLANSNNGQSPIAPAVAIAKGSTAYAFSAGSSIYEGYVDGPAPKRVVTIGDIIHGKVITSIQVAEKNFIGDQGYVAFKAGFSDGTSAILGATPTPGTLPFNPLKSSANCLSCIFTAPTDQEDGFGMDIEKPLYIKINPHGPMAITVPDGQLFTSLLLANFTTDDHGQTPKSFMLHLGAFSTKIFANETIMLNSSLFGGNSDSSFPFNEFGVQSFLLDDFTGFPDDNVILGLTFYSSPEGLDILVQNVPEPACPMLLMWGTLCVFRRRCRNARHVSKRTNG